MLLLFDGSTDLGKEIGACVLEAGNRSLALSGVGGLPGRNLTALLLSLVGISMAACSLICASSGNIGVVRSAFVLGGSDL